ncbi:DUF4259 domain-containing protein [Streptomyces abyssomicinicus]|uniref:DUF4259 domain-containing protein n=1 Tax=Streptomyces abyssomicinicus TaxID=574929 RepID=UPI0012501057|nr:DUF4259 domain-containing protein [Streptomyces abyssomicinicus]
MGTWDTGPFDNDTAADFCGALDEAAEGERLEMVRAVLLRAAGTDLTVHLDAPLGEEAVAAAALVAGQCPRGEPVDTPYAPDEPLPDLTGLRAPAAESLERVVTGPSDLLELWEGDPAWLSVVRRLRDALLPEPVGEQLAFG